ncbi:MAG TPA: sigma-70 family RNA polymerase sigma factor [Candidatus Dormibacteraeota bacterium]|nr:sigma-70 family RNA polymerase sigma factor [Candidatus Dormibacteraeota bacterium]
MSVGPKDVDGEIAAQLQRGDAAAIGRLYDQYGRQAYGLALRIVNDRGAAEDVVQDAFLRVWRAAGSYDTSRGTLRNWLLSVVHNRAIDRVRGTAKIRRETHLGAIERRAEVPDAWAALSLDLERKQIQEAFAQLPEAQRRTLELAYFGGYTHAEIARRMDVPLGTVKGRMRMGLEKMRSFLQARGVTA